MRKTGVTNRIALSVHALTHSLMGVGQAEYVALRQPR